MFHAETTYVDSQDTGSQTHASVEQTAISVLDILDEINALANDLGHDVKSVLEDFKEKIINISHLYHAFPDQYPKLINCFLDNLAVFRNIKEELKTYTKSIDENDIKKCIASIDELHLLITEQNISTSITNIYHNLTQTELGSQAGGVEEGPDALAQAIKQLEGFFKNAIKNFPQIAHDRIIKSVYTILQDLRSGNVSRLTNQFFILLAQTLNKVPTEDLNRLDALSVKNLSITITNLVENLKTFGPINIVMRNHGNPEKRQKIDHSIVFSDSDDQAWRKSSLIFAELFGTYCSKYDLLYKQIKKEELPVYLCQMSTTLLNQMYVLYNRSPVDFPHLLETFSVEATRLTKRCEAHSKDEKKVGLLKTHLEMFYEYMLKRHFHMSMCVLYNSIFYEQPSKLIKDNQDWPQAFGTIITFLDEFDNKLVASFVPDNVIQSYEPQKHQELINRVKAKNDLLKKIFNNVKERIELSLKSSLECVLFKNIIADTQQYIIELTALIKANSEIKDLKPQVFEKIVDAMQDSLIEIDKSFSCKRATGRRMQIISQVAVEISQSTLQNVGNIVLFPKKASKEEELKKQAKLYNLTCANSPKNGDCLFWSLAVVLQNQNHPQFSHLSIDQAAANLRNDANKYILTHSVDFQEFVTAPVQVADPKNIQKNVVNNVPKNDPAKNLKEFVEKSTKRTEWGGNHHLVALCHVLDLRIVVINSDGSQPLILGKREAAYTVCLGYEVKTNKEGTHYQALLPSDGSKQVPKEILDLIDKNIGQHYLPEKK